MGGQWTFEVKDDAGGVHRISAATGEEACGRAADLWQVTVIAWRHPRVDLLVGMGED